MDQPQNTDPKAAQGLISLLTKEVTDLRNENTELQNQLSGTSREMEGAGDGAKSYDDLLEEIDELKGELSERPSQEEVDELEEKIREHKYRKREWRDSVNYLSTQLSEAQSARNQEEGLKEELEWEVEKLRKDLKERIREKEEALARVESQRSDAFDIREFLRGGLGELPPRPNPVTMTYEEQLRFFASTKKKGHIFPTGEAGVIKWADEGGRFVVCLPSVVYNGKTQLTEPFGGNLVTNFLYEVPGADNVYYGTYRCIEKVTIDWDVLTSFGWEFVASFLDRVVVQKNLAVPAIASLIRHMYQTGTLKAECLAFQC